MYPHLWHSEGTTQNKEKMELTIFVLSLVFFLYTVFLLLCSSSSSSSRFVERFTLMCYESRWAGTNESLMLIWNCSCWSLGAEENPVTMLSDHQIRDWDCSTICYSSLLRIKIFIFLSEWKRISSRIRCPPDISPKAGLCPGREGFLARFWANGQRSVVKEIPCRAGVVEGRSGSTGATWQLAEARPRRDVLSRNDRLE